MGTLATIFGYGGSGKTYSLGTILKDTDKKVIVITTEPKVKMGIAAFFRDNKLKPENYKGRLHFVTIIPDEVDTKSHIKMLELSARIPSDEVLKAKDTNRKTLSKYLQSVFENTECVVTDKGENLGSVSSLDSSYVMVIDNLTMLTHFAELHVKGKRPALTQPEIGQVQHWLKSLVIMFKELASRKNSIHLVMLAHPTELVDENDKVKKTQVMLIGRALNSWYYSQFVDVIYAYKKGGKYFWATEKPKVACRTSNLPMKDSLPQNFAPLFKAAEYFENEDMFSGF